MTTERELPRGDHYSHAGTRYQVTDAVNPWGLPIGAELEEVRRGEFWDKAIPPPIGSLGDCWVWLRPFTPVRPPEGGFIGNQRMHERAKPVLLEALHESGTRAWAATWLTVQDERRRPTDGATANGVEVTRRDVRQGPSS
jgi:hypothetical protein